MFLAVLAIAALSVYGIERIDADRARSQARATAADVGAALEHRAITQVTYLRAGALLLSASGTPSAQSFREVAASVATDDESLTDSGIAWAARLAPADVPAFENARRAEGQDGYTVHPRAATGGDFLVPVTYATTVTGHANPALGYDMASEPRRRAAITSAARLSRPIATGKVPLLQRVAGVKRTGFIIYMPVYAKPAAGSDVRRRRLLGFISAPFDARVFLDAALATVPARGLDVSLYDRTIAPDNLLARVAGNADPALSFTRMLMVGGRKLVLVVAAPGHGVLSTLSLATLLFAVVVGLLLTLLARVITRNAQEDSDAIEWMNEQIAIRNTLTRELNHRVKNTLANVLSIIALTRRRATGLEEFAQSLTGRIMALSATHDLLTRLSWEPAPLHDIIAAEMAPYTEDGDHVVAIAGPPVALAPSDALSLGMALHELATNASKYGALSVPGGQVSVAWQMMTPDLLRMAWQEQGGPQVPQQRGRGFGTVLIEKIVAHELGHGVDLDFDPAGLRCVMMVPVRLPAAFQIKTK